MLRSLSLGVVTLFTGLFLFQAPVDAAADPPGLQYFPNTEVGIVPPKGYALDAAGQFANTSGARIAAQTFRYEAFAQMRELFAKKMGPGGTSLRSHTPLAGNARGALIEGVSTNPNRGSGGPDAFDMTAILISTRGKSALVISNVPRGAPSDPEAIRAALMSVTFRGLGALGLTLQTPEAEKDAEAPAK